MNEQVIRILAEGVDKASGPLGKVKGAMSGLGTAGKAMAIGGLALGAAALGGVALAAKEVFDFSNDASNAMKLFGAQTGITGTDLDAFKESAKDLWVEGFGENITDVVEQMSVVKLGLQGNADETANWTKDAMTLSKVFELDVGESINWVSSMTKSMGISADEAFDIITKGMQMGLDVGGDFGDTLHEYSGDFARLGLKGPKVLAMLNAGLKAGAHNTDVIADGWREYNIRLMEGGDDISEVFDQMGMDFEGISASVATGDEVWGDYASDVVEGLMGIENEVERNAAGVAIFGSKWEDVGGDIFIASGLAQAGIEGIEGSTDAAGDAMATGLGPAIERLKRTAIESLSPLGDKIGEVLAKATPYIESFAEWLGENIPIAMEKVGKFWDTTLKPVFDQVVKFIKDPVIPIIEKVVDWLGENIPKAFKIIEDIWKGVLKPVFEAIWQIIENVVIPIVKTIFEWLSENIPKAFEIIKGFWENTLKPVFNAISDFIEGTLVPIIETVVDWLGENIPKAFEAIGSFWNNTLKPVFEAIKNFIADTLIPAIGSIAEGFEAAFNAAKNTVKSIINVIIGIVEGGINLIIRIINGLIDGANVVANLLPGVSPIGKIGEVSFGRLEKGGLIVAPEMLAQLHGPEVVLPLDSPETTRALANALSTAINAGGNGRSSIPTVTVNMHFGRDSVRDDQDILDIADAIDDALAIRGVQPAL